MDEPILILAVVTGAVILLGAVVAAVEGRSKGKSCDAGDSGRNAVLENASDRTRAKAVRIPIRLGHLTHTSDHHYHYPLLSESHETWTDHYLMTKGTLEIPTRGLRATKTRLTCSVCGKEIVVKAFSRGRVMVVTGVVRMLFTAGFLCALYYALRIMDEAVCCVVLVVILGIPMAKALFDAPLRQFRVCPDDKEHRFFDWPTGLV